MRLQIRNSFWFLSLTLLVVCAALTDVRAQRPQLVIQTGHSDEVRAIAFSPDGKILASGSTDNTVRVWDVVTGVELIILSGHPGGVYSVVFSPDGKILASAGADQTIRLWNVASGKEMRSLSASAGVLVSLAFSPDGRTLACATLNRTIELWDVNTGQRLRTLAGHASEVISVAFSPDGKSLASGGNDQTVKIWDPETGKNIRTLNGHTAEVYSVAFSPDGKTLASGSADQTVVLWNVAAGKEIRSLRGHTGLVKSVSFTPDGKVLVSGSTDDTIRMWSVSTGAETRSLLGNSAIGALAVSPDGESIATGNRDKTLSLWDIPTGALRRTLKGQSVVVSSVAFSPDSTMFAIANRDATIKLLSTVTGAELRTLEERSGVTLSIAFSPAGNTLASGNSDQTVRLWDLKTGKIRNTLAGHFGRIASVAFNPNGKILASGSSDKTAKLWDLPSGRELLTLTGHTGSVNSVVFSPDGNALATASSDKTIRIWNVATGAEQRSLIGHRQNITCVAFAADGKTLASGGEDGEIKIWDSRTGQLISTIAGGKEAIYAVTFSPDGKTLASAGGDGLVRLWDPASHQEMRRLIGNHGPVYTVALSPNGKILASGGRDAVTRLWDISTGQELASVLSSGPGNWLIATPDNLFDGSPTSWNDIHWSFSDNLLDVAPLEAFFNDFFYPGLLADIFAGNRPKAPRAITQKDHRTPQIKLTAETPADRLVSTRTIELSIEVTDNSSNFGLATQAAGSGAMDLRLFRNGSRIKLWAGDVLRGQSHVTLRALVPIGAGENKFTAYAFNRDNIKSSDESLVIAGADSLKRSGTFYVLAVGINEYSNREFDLRYSASDAQALAAEMQKQQERLGNYSPIKIIPLLDQEATKANIMLALKRLGGEEIELPPNTPVAISALKPAQIEDAVVIFFAGHGVANQQRFFLVPHDLGFDGRRSEINPEVLRTILSHSISDVELEEVFNHINAGHLLLVLDAASSGQALEAEEKRRGPMNSKSLAQLAYEKGMYILTAAQSFQQASESTQFGHGLMTYALLEGLTSGKADEDRDGRVTALEWLEYATARVPALQIEMQRLREVRHHAALGSRTDPGQNIETERQIQRPRIFYRRELEGNPLIVAKP